MSRSTPFLIGKRAGDGDARTAFDAREAARSAATPHTPSPVEQTAVTMDFKNSRREGFSMEIDPTDEHSKLPHSTRIPYRQDRRLESISEKNEIQQRNFSAICTGPYLGSTCRGTSA